MRCRIHLRMEDQPFPGPRLATPPNEPLTPVCAETLGPPNLFRTDLGDSIMTAITIATLADVPFTLLLLNFGFSFEADAGWIHVPGISCSAACVEMGVYENRGPKYSHLTSVIRTLRRVGGREATCMQQRYGSTWGLWVRGQPERGSLILSGL